MEHKKTQFAVALDMHGCPNRCKHCWIGHAKNPNVSITDFLWLTEQFRDYERNHNKYFDGIEFVSWYREPDYPDNYKELWELEKQTSDRKTAHFENISFWRMNRDPEYAPWLNKLGVDFIQLRFFGMEQNTDYFTGRKGAYRELLKSIDIMLDYGMVPRIQMFPFITNIGDFAALQSVFEEMKLEKRCRQKNREFVCYFHLPTADGEAFNLEGIRIKRQEAARLPDYFVQKTKRHFKSDNIEKLWQTEAEIVPELMADTKPFNDTPFFETLYVTGNFDVYPNISSQDPWWCLGNLKTDGVDVIMDNYINRKNFGLKMNYEMPVKYFAEKYGNPAGDKLFAGKDSILLKWWKLEGMNHEKGINAVRN